MKDGNNISDLQVMKKWSLKNLQNLELSNIYII